MAGVNNTKVLKLRVIHSRTTQTELSKKIGLSQSCINQLEIGTQTNPSLDTVVKYLTNFNISFFEFVDKETAKKLLISFTKNLVDDEVIDIEKAAEICRYYEVKF